MILIENTEVTGFEAAVRGMRNPMNSWEKSDSFLLNGHLVGENVVGENDLALMKKLVKAGTDHAKFMRMITVTCDITAPLYWIKEHDTYKVGTVRNSCSTMHKIHAKEFTVDDFSDEYIRNFELTADIISFLNRLRELYLGSRDTAYWYAMIQLLPSSYNQRYTWSANYAVLRNIYQARKNHRLDEWHTFCEWIEDLPCSELMTE